MKIALISEHASPLATLGGIDSGGQNVYVAHIARQLGRNGHSVDVFTRRDDPSLPPVIRFAPNVRVYPVPAGPPRFIPKEQLLPYMGEFGAGILAVCERSVRPYDVVHANFFMSGLVALRLRETLGIPLVMTFHALSKVRRFHQGSADGFPDVRVDIEKLIVDTADRIVAECPQDREDLIRLYGADDERIEVVPCGVDTTELGFGDGASRQRLELGDEEFVVLQLGRLVPRKGVDNVVRGVAELRRRHGIDARLLIVGGESMVPDPALTPEIGRLQEIARQEGIAENVRFVGQRQRAELRDYYCAANVFVSTPWYEPFGITPLEAMACARPVIGSAVGGIAHTVVDGVTGYLVPPKDPVTLATRLALLHDQPGTALALGQAGLCRVRNHFTWAKVVRSLIDLYYDVSRPARRTALAAETQVINL